VSFPPPLPTDLPSFTARFNARTGQFTPASARQPGHLSEHERAKRMSEFYFDVGKWEEDLARRGGRLMAEEDDPAGEEGAREKKRKRPSKKDLVRFCASFFSLWIEQILFPLRRIGLKNKKDSRKSLKQLGCVLNFFWRYISMYMSLNKTKKKVVWNNNVIVNQELSLLFAHDLCRPRVMNVMNVEHFPDHHVQ
jgi:hypothetical protein